VVRALNGHALLKPSIIMRACASTKKGGGGSIEFALPRRWLALEVTEDLEQSQPQKGPVAH